MNAFPLKNEMLEALQQRTFGYFLYEVNPENGLVADKTYEGSPASIATIGLALTAYPVGVERGFMSREQALERTLRTLRFFRDSKQGPETDATGFQGFYYHFLDMKTGRRVWNSELSTVDSAFLIAGMLMAARYFQNETAEEAEIRQLADELYRRVNWQWALNGGATLSHGWKPESGFLPYRWQGYDEAMLLYFLALGSPTYPVGGESYAAWTSTYVWRKVYEEELLFNGSLFTHQLSHIWIDFRGIADPYLRKKQIDYFENSRRATYVQQQYAIDNPLEFEAYGRNCWGLTACDGPGPVTLTIHGRRREFFNYVARAVPDGPDDGTIAPWAVVASLPFAPEIVLPVIEWFEHLKLSTAGPYGFKSTFNPTYPRASHDAPFWTTTYHCGLNHGPIVLMLENYWTGMLWEQMRRCPYLVKGLKRAGFAGGWLEGSV